MKEDIMFRTPIYAYHGTEPSAVMIHEYINAAITEELRRFFKKPDGFDNIKVPSCDPTTWAEITREEIDTVDIDKLIEILPIYECGQMLCVIPHFKRGSATEEFIASKFIQLVKLVKTKEAYTPDLFQEMMLVYIAQAGDTEREVVYARKEELIDMLTAEAKEDFAFLGEDETEPYNTDEEFSEAPDYIRNACRNLHGAIEEEDENEIGWLLWDRDYTCLLDWSNSGNGIMPLLLGVQDYPEEYFREMYNSVGYAVPEDLVPMLLYATQLNREHPFVERMMLMQEEIDELIFAETASEQNKR